MAAARRRPSRIGILRMGLRGAAVVLLAWAVLWALSALVSGAVLAVVANTPVTLLAAACLYGLGHLMRIVRLALLIGDARLSLRRLGAFHLYTAGVSLSAPFRVGDAYRAVELGAVTGVVTEGLVFVWIERVLDAALILPMLFLALLAVEQPGAFRAYAGIAGITALFVLVSVLLVALLPDNLRRVGTYLIRRHEADWTVHALRLIDQARATIHRIPALLGGKVASLVALTVLVWAFELTSMGVVLAGWAPGLNPLGGLLAFLSATTAGGTLPEVILVAHRAPGFVVAYLSAGQIPLAFVALVASVYYLKSVRRGRAR